MIQPITIADKLLFTTAKIITDTGVGTGFFVQFNIKDRFVLVLVTNKHVIDYNKDIKCNIQIHLTEKNTIILGNIPVEFQASWVFHPDPNIDLCCAPILPLNDIVKQKFNKEVFFYPLSDELFNSESSLETLRAIEDVVMIGYPIGISDEYNNLPIIRKGITSSHPMVNFNGQNIGIVDMACFPGSSGSPIFIYNGNGYVDNRGNVNMGNERLIFLGVLFEGPTMTIDGEIEIVNIPTKRKQISRSEIMINLGHYIKAKELLVLKEEVRKVLKM